MSDLPPLVDDGEDLTAAEYALGVLDRTERTAAEARALREPAFAAEVQAWDERLSPLIDLITPVTPPASTWPHVVRALDGTGAANDTAGYSPTRHTVAFWRNWALGASAAAAAALVVLAIRPAQIVTAPLALAPAPAVQPILVAQLSGAGQGVLTATYDPAKGAIYAVPGGALNIPKDRSAELWLIPADGAPRSLGVVDPGKPTLVKVSDVLKPGALPAATLAITIEQPGGSPNGKPTTSPKWVGKLATI